MFQNILLWGKADQRICDELQSRTKFEIRYKHNKQPLDTSIHNLYYIVWDKNSTVDFKNFAFSLKKWFFWSFGFGNFFGIGFR